MAGRLYVEDTCALKTKPEQIWVVERTSRDFSSPQIKVHDLSQYPDTPNEAFEEVVRSGIPPEGYVVAACISLPQPPNGELSQEVPVCLIKETHLELLDRSLFVGEIVKKDLRDASSGTVIHCTVEADLIPPRPWPEPRTGQASSTPNINGNFSVNPRDVLHRIPISELRHASDWGEHQFVMYNDWIGRVEAVEDGLTLRLGDGNVVEVEDPMDIVAASSNDRLAVGDWVQTRKGNLRRGHWKYGAYNPNTPPTGFVAEVQVKSITVHWLCRRYDPSAALAEPSGLVECDLLESGQVKLFTMNKLGYGDAIGGGDRVKFLDPTRGRPVPRSSSLGYDINTFLVRSTISHATVQWQDGTTSTHRATELVPDIDLDDDDGFWPGEIVATREGHPLQQTENTFRPLQVGVVQSVNANDRIANVRWFPDANVSLTGDEHSVLLPGSSLGRLADTIDHVSVYDIWWRRALRRRLGDHVMVLPDGEESTDAWFGQVSEVGCDGLVAVSWESRSARVPLERTVVVFNTDGEDSEFDEDFGTDFDDGYSDEYEFLDDQMHVSIEYDGEAPQDDNEEAWSTESASDEESDTPMTDAEATSDLLEEAAEADFEATRDESPDVHMAMQEDTNPEESPPRYAVLDTAVPSDHHFLPETTRPPPPAHMRRIHKEHRILSTSLPEGVYVRTWESRLDLLRVLFIGPVDTPYEYAPFIVDLHMHNSFPENAPRVFFHSWTSGNGPINPNLYEDGTICLSLLGTWQGRASSETWNVNKSTVLQVLVSLLGLVLVEEPYYNEAGYEQRAGNIESALPSALYSERTYFRSRGFIAHALRNPVAGLSDVIEALYCRQLPGDMQLLVCAIEAGLGVVRRSRRAPSDTQGVQAETSDADKGRRVSAGARIPLRRQVSSLIELLAERDQVRAEELRKRLEQEDG